MRPPRIAILALFLAASIFILGRAFTSASRPHASSSYTAEARTSRSVFGFMYYNTPFSLFPPNAAISLTDDNSTSFAARPAAFGPKLAAHGLSGQLWVGSGFAEDSQDGDGELGCSDLPGWGSGNTRAALRNSFRADIPRITASHVKSDHPKRGGQLLDPDHREAISRPGKPSREQLTDENSVSRRNTPSSSSSSPAHADIQSIQEAAEIQGNVVLLMRGGCGFLEKVMWAQRRGAVAVIVGDNQKGGPLIQMFAHGDEVDNVTVPSVFTARTTAHLLSSLTQPGSFIEDTLDDSGNPVRKVQQGPKIRHDTKKQTLVPGRTATLRHAVPPSSRVKRAPKDTAEKPAPSGFRRRSWLLRMLGWGQSPLTAHDGSRPPSSGRLNWSEKATNGSPRKSTTSKATDDDFIIGVQDWRDPDLVGRSPKKGTPAAEAAPKTTPSSKKQEGGSKNALDGPKGGSITPGSGEYNPSKSTLKDGKEAANKSDGKGHGLISKLFGDEDAAAVAADGASEKDAHDTESPNATDRDGDFEGHEGLWVTITPTSSASPFFDTLLVLVISPLVTLTVVYALLIVRARVRRRWRAPKSVVDRLPVRTYRTVAPSPSLCPSPRLPSPSSASPTTPLLQQSPSRPRPRSRTTTGVLQSENFLVPSVAVPTPQPPARGLTRSEHEKGSSGFSAEWKKYMGRQVECVVCLEEYVDGVSRVMSLPCGHEFHADCITPWLTTRRRTCPICKGDVVRSLARSSRDDPRYEPYHDGPDDEAEAEASSSRPIDGPSDLERGILSPRDGSTPHSGRQERWLGLLSTSFGSRARPRSQTPPAEDRNR